MANPPDNHGSILDALSSGWAWLSALLAGIFHVGVTAQRFKQVEEKVDRLESVLEDIAAIKADLGWIKDRMK